MRQPALRVLHALSDRQLFGAGRYLEVLARGLAQEGLDSEVRLVVACPGGGAMEELARQLGLSVVNLPDADRSFSWANLKAVRRHLRQENRRGRAPQLVHTHANVAAAIAARTMPTVRVVMTRHRFRQRSSSPGAARAGWVAGRLFHRAIAISSSIREDLLAEGWPPARVLLIPNGVDVAAWPGERSDRPDLPVVAMTARMTPEKGHRVLLEAVPLILDSHPETRFQLIGDGPLMPDLRRQAEAMEAADRVQLLGFKSDLARIYKRVSVGVCPSLCEGFGFSAAEFMASGIPVVATGVGGHRELIRSGEHGLLIPPDDHRALAREVVRLLEERHLARQLARAGRERIESQFSAGKMARSLAECYRDLAR